MGILVKLLEKSQKSCGIRQAWIRHIEMVYFHFHFWV